jgi:hypothetical protein
MIAVALALLVAVVPIADADWKPYEDPTKAFTIEVPATWTAEPANDMGFSQIVSFKLPDAEMAFTVSITPNLQLPEELPLDLLKLYFPPEAKLSEPRREKGEGWNSVRQEATAEMRGVSRTWLGAFWGVGSTMVALTFSGKSGTVEMQRLVFERIVKSMKLRPNAKSTPDLAA